MFLCRNAAAARACDGKNSGALCGRPPIGPIWNESKKAGLIPRSAVRELLMRTAGSGPSIVPHGDEHNVYIVEHDSREHGRVWAEVSSESPGFEPVVMYLLTGQYTNPIRVVAFNIAAGWCRDASVEVAHELRRRCDLQLRDIPFFLQDFVDRYEGRYQDIQLPLPMRLY
ncbi:hypothetical protein CQ13_08845 [Bradyrhizobium retamae]|uniref:Uncharacterized protein n=2 Tax=Bradyrhizobium retamae TaxID=1300035 RepID=A0A0R3MR39_9BRAD|nr:hypothetical protein CQ13_08845 [Bradyrhizobium retamae]